MWFGNSLRNSLELREPGRNEYLGPSLPTGKTACQIMHLVKLEEEGKGKILPHQSLERI